MRKSPKRVLVKKSEKELNGNPLWEVLLGTKGNYKVIKTFVSEMKANEYKTSVQREWYCEKATTRVPREQMGWHKTFSNEL